MPKSLRFIRNPLAWILTGLVLATPAWAAGGPPMITDDPGTPGDGHWEINLATLSSHSDDAATYQLPLLDINYGIGDRLQLKLEMPWLLRDEAGEAGRSAAGNGLLGVKWRFYDGGEQDWQISTYPQLEFGFPLNHAQHDALADQGTSYLLPFEFLHAYENFDVNLELGRWLRPVQEPDSWIAGVVLTHEVKKGFELLAELHDEAAVHQTQDELILNIGTRWDLSDNSTLLLSAGRDLHNSLSEKNTLLTYFGLQMRY